jgi:tetratricopeptide (TPR) repeat protein
MINKMLRLTCSGMSVMLGCVLGLLAFTVDAETSAVNAADYGYAINIGSSTSPAALAVIENPELANKYVVYTSKVTVGGSERYRQRIGFFTSQQQAAEVVAQLKAQFPDAWVDKTRADETSVIERWLASSQPATASVAVVVAPAVLPQPAVTNVEAPVAAEIKDERLAALMEDARLAIVAREYDKAIRIYSRVMDSGNPVYQKEALEYLGVARERNGQLAHASAEYKKYLKLYPEGEDAERVKQRLTGLLTASDQPQAKMNTDEKSSRPSHWEFFGTWMQFYDRDVINTDATGSIVGNSLLTSSFNHNGRLMDSAYKMRTSFSMLHIYDFEEGETDQTRVNELYIDMLTPEQVWSTRAGRQKGRSSGVVGRFDGVDLGYRFHPAHQLRLIAGYPVEFDNSTVDHETDKHFYSIGYDWFGFLPDWDMNIFRLEQIADGLVDREEVGGELRYRTSQQSFFGMLDYSTAFGEINYLMMTYNRNLGERETIDVIADYRKSPFLTTTSSLQGQTRVGVSTLEDLTASLTQEELDQLALERTALYKSLTVLYARPLSEKMDFNADATVSNLSGTDLTAASGTILEVPAQEGTGNEYSISAGIVANNWLTQNDINIVNVRYGDLFDSTVITLNASAKYRLDNAWRVSPKLRLEWRDYDDGRSMDKMVPSVRAEYRRNRNWQFESEIIYESKDTSSIAGSVSESNYTLHLGYIYSF